MVQPVIFYDGDCGLCNRFVQYILKNDDQKQFLFSSQQSDHAMKVGLPSLNETLFVFNKGKLLHRSAAVIEVLKRLGGLHSFVARLLKLFPARFLDFLYNLVAKNRFAILGKNAQCFIPDASQRARFLE